MSLATKLLSKADRLMRRFDVTYRTAYKRIYTRTGGDALIGRPGTSTFVETLIDPPPVITGLDINFGSKPRDTQIIVNGEMMIAGDILALTTPTAITMAELSDKGFIFVMKDSLGVEEEYHLVTYETTPVNGTIVLFNLLLRSRGR